MNRKNTPSRALAKLRAQGAGLFSIRPFRTKAVVAWKRRDRLLSAGTGRGSLNSRLVPARLREGVARQQRKPLLSFLLSGLFLLR